MKLKTLKEETPKTDEKKCLSLYIHIPFCKAKCVYCDFLSFGGSGFDERKNYITALCREIEAYAPVAKAYQVATIFFGGGTPSYLEASLVEQVMETIYRVFSVEENAEITIEGNPESLTKDKLLCYRQMGFDRLSIGLQSTNDTILHTMGRVHDYEQFVTAYHYAREAGFSNINIDLMSGIPGESRESYIQTLTKVLQLEPEHISAYSLIVEEDTPLSQNQELLAQLPSEEEDRMLYATTKKMLLEQGYHRYEISNYAKEGFACRHNIVYWTGGEYLGLGLGAASYLTVRMDYEKYEKIRFHGTENMREYIQRFLFCDGMREDDYTNLYHLYEVGESVEGDESQATDKLEEPGYQNANDDAAEDVYDVYDEDDIYEDMGFLMGMNLFSDDNGAENRNLQRYRSYEKNALLEFIRDYYKELYFSKRKDEMEEFMFLGLRMTDGISKEEFQKRFSVEIESVYGNVIQKYKKRDLLKEKAGRLYLSDQGIDVSNMVMAEFML